MAAGNSETAAIYQFDQTYMQLRFADAAGLEVGPPIGVGIQGNYAQTEARIAELANGNVVVPYLDTYLPNGQTIFYGGAGNNQISAAAAMTLPSRATAGTRWRAAPATTRRSAAAASTC